MNSSNDLTLKHKEKILCDNSPIQHRTKNKVTAKRSFYEKQIKYKMIWNL